MTLFYPDIASYQAGIDLSGAPAVSAKATEGTGYTNPYFGSFKAEAAKHSTYFFAYHFLTHGNGAAQADYAYAVVGRIPLMLDFEPSGTSPTVADAEAFIDRYRARGGIVYFLYLPQWYWVRLGSPSLRPFADRKMLLVSSHYGDGYTDANSGAGWQPYGGMTPTVWQFTSSKLFNGMAIDFNAYRGTLTQFKALVSTGKLPADEHPTLSLNDTGDAVRLLQQRLNVWGAKLAVDGDFGPATLAAVKGFQSSHNLTADGIVGPLTWAALLKNPPTDFTYGPPVGLQVTVGRTSAKFAWQPPEMPEGTPIPAYYLVYVYNTTGGKPCSRSTQVASYPRVATASPFQGGSLGKLGGKPTTYTVHVVASGPDNSHIRPYTYAEATFTYN